jgi:ubiquinone/menaquinone biosynthesis C-methylase UbiE
MEFAVSTFVLFIVVLLLWFIATLYDKQVEMFENPSGESDTREDALGIYDDFYAKIYNMLFNSPEKTSFERVSMREMMFDTFSKPETKILDVCCGTSAHAKTMTEDGYDFVGMDVSEPMLKIARRDCPSARFYKADAKDASSFPPKSFSHALLLHFSIYQFPNPKIVIDNIYQWLKPEGYLVVHLVNPEKFDPVLDASSPFPAFSIQKYNKQRVTESDIYFNNFKYKAKFVKAPDEEEALFEETFTFSKDDAQPKYRENKHHLYMPSVNAMIDLIRSSGFSLIESIDMTQAGYEYQYIVYFQK